MWKQASLSFVALLTCFFVFVGSASSQQPCDPIDRKQLREKLVQLGYDIKDLVTDPGKEKYSTVVVRDGLDIPIAFELSGSAKYIWLTVNLGNAPAANLELNNTLLKQNSKIQPCLFYITDAGRLMMGLPLNNLGVTNAYLRERIEFIATNVGSTKLLWQR
jgi:hypothetical protein